MMGISLAAGALGEAIGLLWIGAIGITAAVLWLFPLRRNNLPN